MTEEISFLSEENTKTFIDKFENQQVFNEIVELVGNNEQALTEIRIQTTEYLERLIINGLKEYFDKTALSNPEEELANFIKKLSKLKSGKEQIEKINEKLFTAGESFWKLIEQQLHNEFLNALLKELKS